MEGDRRALVGFQRELGWLKRDLRGPKSKQGPAGRRPKRRAPMTGTYVRHIGLEWDICYVTYKKENFNENLSKFLVSTASNNVGWTSSLTKKRSQLVSKNFDPEAEKGLLEHVVVEIRVQVKIDRTN